MHSKVLSHLTPLLLGIVAFRLAGRLILAFNFPAFVQSAGVAELPGHGDLDKERMAHIHDTLSKLSPLQRQCVHLRVEGFRYREIAAILSTPDAREWFASFALEPGGEPPAVFARIIRDEYATWGTIIRDNHVKAE